MKKVLYFLAALIGFTAVSCQEDDVTFNSVNDLDRLPMPMFRKKHNTNISDEADQFATKVIPGTYNAIQVHWYGIEGAAGYQVRIRLGVGSGGYDETRAFYWEPENNPDVKEVTVPADQLHTEFYNLEYKKVYSFAIRALHPDGKEEHHSQWYGYGGGQEWEDYMQVETLQRYKTPTVMAPREKDYDGFKLLLDLDYNRSAYTQEDADTIESRFRITPDGKFGVTHMIVKAASANPNAVVPAKFEYYPVQQSDIDNGYIQLEGLSESSLYSIVLKDELNDKAAFDSDKMYNAINFRTKGDPGAPILIEHKLDPNVYTDRDSIWNHGEHEYNACRLDTVIDNFNRNTGLAEGQVFYLQGGKAYYISTNQNINKGFTLCTDPADVLEGKRAIVYMGGITMQDGKPLYGSNCVNWNLGKQPDPSDLDAPIAIESVIFRDIDFQSPHATNFGDEIQGKGGKTGNYFCNMYSNGLGVEFESFEMHNCTVQGAIRGFFRVQGPNKKVFKKLIINNCVFFNGGYYDTSGSGYAWFAGAGNNKEDNIWEDFQFTNNTIYDTPRRSMIYDNGKDLAWGSDIHWNCRIENNTFINYSTRSSGRYFFDMKFAPGGSTFTFKRNLICLAKAANDLRPLHQSGCLLQTINGDGSIHIDIAENYSTGCEDSHMEENGIFTASPFTANSKSFGDKEDGFAPGVTIDDLKIHVGSTPLRSDELFNDPNPSYRVSNLDDDAVANHGDTHGIDPEKIWTRLQYKNDLKVTQHEIFTKNIGDQRWKTSDPKWFLPN